jgi:hypothetical protein
LADAPLAPTLVFVASQQCRWHPELRDAKVRCIDEKTDLE